jgi:hypothetical protein
MANKKKGKNMKKSKPAAGRNRKSAKRSPTQKAKKATAKNRNKSAPRKSTKVVRRSRRGATRIYDAREVAAFERETAGSGSGGQSGDLQGLRDVPEANVQSVGELLEEGNAFEADVVAGVEHAGDSEGREVHTHEVPEDDVPKEYRDKDS